MVRSRDATLTSQQWPATLAPIAHALERGLDLAQATVVVGENGTGKSTFVEAVAMAYGLSGEGGSTGARHSTRPTESPLGESISRVRGPGASRWGHFVRAGTMHGLFTYLEQNPSPRGETRFHELSHGESFIAMLNSNRRGALPTLPPCPRALPASPALSVRADVDLSNTRPEP